jgi:hemerythrin
MLPKWTQAMSTGVDVLDKDHQEIFRQTDLLLQAMKEGNGRAEVKRILDFLENYVPSHFAREEKLMEEYNCPVAKLNKAAHADFVALFQDLKTRYESSTVSSTLVLATMYDWLKEHIEKIDSKLKYCTSNASQEPALSR